MQEWIRQILSADQAGLAVLPAAFLFGVPGPVSACCTLPVIGAVAGYAGGFGERRSRRQVAGASLERYWRFAAGLMMVLFGLIAVGLLQLRIPKLNLAGRAEGRGVGGALVYGLALGYSLPLAAGLVGSGLGIGRLGSVAARVLEAAP